jgi:uncharacterized protein (DUF885 family)
MKLFHLQISLQQENASPDFRKYNWFGAYVEGWALLQSLGKKGGIIPRYLSILWNASVWDRC